MKQGGQRWKIIAPFLRPLRSIAFLQLDERVREGHLQSCCAGLVLTLPVESSVEDQRRLRTAVELLHTLWTLDRDAWRCAIADDSGVGIDFPESFVQLPADKIPHVVVRVKHDKFPWQIQSPARWSELLEPQATLPSEAAAAKALLLRKYGAREQDIPKSIPLVLQFLVLGLANSVIEAYLCSIVDMVAAIQRTLNAVPSPGFELVWLDLELSQCEMTSRRARQVERLHALGIPFRELTLRLFEVDGREQLVSTEKCDFLLTTLIGSSQKTADPFSVETLVIDKADVGQFGSVCTAVETTKTVKNLQLNNVFTFDTPEGRVSKWQWLTNALFASASRSSIKHLSLQQFEFQATDATTVHNELEAIQTRTSAGNIHDQHSLETLTIRTEACQGETIEAIPAVVALIGANLRALSVYAWVGAFTETSVRDMLTACRHLELLDLSSLVLDSFDVFLEAFDNPTCNIRSLALHEVDVPSVHVTAFARALSDPTRRCTQVLRELCLDAVGSENTPDEANMDAFLELMQKNKTLEYLDLRVPEPLRSTYRPLFEKHNQTWLPKASEPLIPSSKAAFLSLTRPIRRNTHEHEHKHSQLPSHEHAIEALDDRVVSLIFVFAATRAKRTVCIGEA